MKPNRKLKTRMYDNDITQPMVAQRWNRSITYVSRRMTEKDFFNTWEVADLARWLDIHSTDDFMSTFFPDLYEYLKQMEGNNT